MENINDNDPTPESDGEAHDSDSIADETLDLGVSDEIPELEDGASEDGDVAGEYGGFTIDSGSENTEEAEADSADIDPDVTGDVDSAETADTDTDVDVDADVDAETDILAAAAELQNDDHWGDALDNNDVQATDTNEAPELPTANQRRPFRHPRR